jgi:hypothetical protein
MMSEKNIKTIALRVSNDEFMKLKAIAKHLHSQQYYDGQDKKHKKVLQTEEPAELLRLALTTYVSNWIIPDHYMVSLNLTPDEYKEWKANAHFYANNQVKDFFTGKMTRVLEEPTVESLAFVGTNTFLGLMKMLSQMAGIKRANADVLQK